MKKIFVTIFTKVVFGTLIVGRTAASAMPAVPQINHENNAWSNVRREIERFDHNQGAISLDHWLASESVRLPLAEAIADSYSRVPSSEWLALDAHWVTFVGASGNDADAEVFIKVRAEVIARLSGETQPNTRQEYLDQWLLKANGHCYSGGGSGNCGVGLGGGGGNGTSDEGQGNDP
ncbi:hypothetical protein ACSBLW_01040 [Thioclava sp. FR2]|uniref:hypothetical protein n=1 Tax=Thioclava sp. FR2 TaxID=3445780 RepID=UPI003EBAFEF9